MEDLLSQPSHQEALQQPVWGDPAQVERVRRILAGRPALVRPEDLRVLSGQLAEAAAGRIAVLQCGDCSEDPGECTAVHVSRKTALLDVLAGTLSLATGTPVLRVGRIAGQFAKPRSSGTELVDGRELPSYRGHMVNGPEPTEESRRPDPLRILTGYMAAADIMNHLGWQRRDPLAAGPVVWSSHEALLLDYEIPMLRRSADGTLYLGSTHWPWIGERTRQLDGAHVELLARVANPVACKVGPGMRTDELLALCERLDPERRPGRLTLISRMGADAVAERLPGLVAAVRAAGHPVIWLCDPMHGNTRQTERGVKTRLVEEVAREVAGFRRAVAAGGGTAAGLHLETTPDDVLECAAHPAELPGIGERYTSLCDPRLNLAQAVAVTAAWNTPPHTYETGKVHP